MSSLTDRLGDAVFCNCLPPLFTFTQPETLFGLLSSCGRLAGSLSLRECPITVHDENDISCHNKVPIRQDQAINGLDSLLYDVPIVLRSHPMDQSTPLMAQLVGNSHIYFTPHRRLCASPHVRRQSLGPRDQSRHQKHLHR